MNKMLGKTRSEHYRLTGCKCNKGYRDRLCQDRGRSRRKDERNWKRQVLEELAAVQDA